MNKRLQKRLKRENRKSKLDSWYCAGCKLRHLNGTSCPNPRLHAKAIHGSNKS